ncbi:putative ribonuclease H domain, reverse transcriptase zinc-binding domain-containing protein [Arabidopsis thaliana]
MEKFFKRVWRVVAPERVRVFLWLVTHQVIMMDMERKRRHMGENSVCQVCNGAEESIMHVLRDCPAMEGIWLRLVPLRERHAFFGMTLLEWLFANLKSESKYGCEIWATLFSMSVWWAWKWRCGNVFGETGKCRDRVRFLKEMAVEVTNAHEKEGGHIQRGGREIMVSWPKPEEDWVALNTDGASRGNPGLATAGGVVRGSDGNWRVGFTLNIGICSAPMAELWGVYYGLAIAWERGFRRVELRVDSELVVGFLRSGVSDAHPLSFLVRLCHGFISRDWLVRVWVLLF